MVTTSLAVDCVDGRHRVRMRHGLLRGQRLHGPPELARVALVGQTALLLGGDEVELQIAVGPGATLELSEVAATVAYDGRGAAAGWTTTIRLEAGARLVWAGEPFVIADGADVTRRTSVELADDATVVLRETLVLGRSAERGGRLRTTSLVRRAGRPVLHEELWLDPADRGRPGLLGDVRVLDSLLVLGCDPAESEQETAVGAVRFRLVDPRDTLTRFLGREVAESPLRRPRARPAMLLG